MNRQIKMIELQPMTRELMHELYRGFSFDPDIFMDMDLYEKNKDYKYNVEKTDALYDMRSAEEGSMSLRNSALYIKMKRMDSRIIV